jgi:hypothetical protein
MPVDPAVPVRLYGLEEAVLFNSRSPIDTSPPFLLSHDIQAAGTRLSHVQSLSMVKLMQTSQ